MPILCYLIVHYCTIVLLFIKYIVVELMLGRPFFERVHGEKPKIVWCYFDTLLMEKSNLIFYFYDHL